MTKPFSTRARAQSFGHAWRGIMRAVQTQHNIWLQLAVAASVIGLGFWFQVSRADWLWLVMAIGLVMVAELLNTALESLSDVVSTDHHPGIRAAKDMAAGAVLVAATASGLIGVLVFWPHLWAG